MQRKGILNSSFIASDINTMKEITANFYGLSHLEQQINGWERAGIRLPLGEPLPGALHGALLWPSRRVPRWRWAFPPQ